MTTQGKGGRPPTGWLVWRKDKAGRPRWHCFVTLKEGKGRPCVPLDPSIPHSDRERAQACAATTSAWYREHARAPDARGETAGEWWKRFHAAKEAKGLSSVRDMRGRASNWILPGIEHKEMRALTREDIEGVVRRLDAAVAAFMKRGPGEGRLSPSTATNVWGDLSHALDEAVRAKDPSLRVLSTNPARDVRGPDAGADREGQILYSDEILALLGSDAVPPYRRHVYAMAIYTKARSSELEALTAADVDLARATIEVTKQADRKSKGRKGTKETKTGRTRTVDIEPNLEPLVRLLAQRPEGKGKRLLHMPPMEDRAELLRRDLRTVGVTRDALHIEGDPRRRAIVFHDLRDTGLTHMAVRGDDPVRIQWTAGHTDFKTTEGYLSRGRVEGRRIGVPLPPLPPKALESAQRGFASGSAFRKTSRANPRESLAILRPQRELKASTEGAPLPENLAGSAITSQTAESETTRTETDSRPMVSLSSSSELQNAEPTDAELERCIVDAVTQRWADVARTLAARLQDRQRARAGNVVALDTKRKG